jgi:hypothetical protein
MLAQVSRKDALAYLAGRLSWRDAPAAFRLMAAVLVA